MSDIYYDISAGSSAGGYETDEGLATAAMLSLLTDSRADDADDVPDDSDLGGWWGSDFADDGPDEFGSKLWILLGQVATDTRRDEADQYIRDALQWMLDDVLVDEITVELEIAYGDWLTGKVTLLRPAQLGQVAVQLWDATVG